MKIVLNRTGRKLYNKTIFSNITRLKDIKKFISLYPNYQENVCNLTLSLLMIKTLANKNSYSLFEVVILLISMA
jgi:hypothetical protein